MSYTPQSHVAFGDIWPAGSHNIMLDNIAYLKSQADLLFLTVRNNDASTINLGDPLGTSFIVQASQQILTGEADILHGLTTTTAELNVLHSAVAGTATASLGVVLDASKDYAGIHTLTLGKNGVGGVAQLLHVGARGFAGDPTAIVFRRGDFAVQRHRGFDCDKGRAVDDPVVKRFI